MRRRIVRTNESFGAPHVTQHVVEAQRLLAREMRLIERPGQRSLPRASERARLGQGRDRARQRRGCIAPNLVGAHRGRGPAVDETALIRRQVKLMQPLVGDVGVEVLVLAVVHDEVLHLGHRTRALHAVDLRGHHLTAQERILAGGRQVSTPVGQPVEIGLRAEHAGDHELPTLSAFQLSPRVAERAVERGAE